MSKRPTRENRRKPIGQRNVLTAPKRDGYVRRFVNDEPGRIQQYLDAGYLVVNDKTQMGDENLGQASQLGSTARKPVGGGVDAVLMEIREDWYKEDQDANEAQLKEKEQGLLLDQNGNAPNQNVVYGEGIKIQSDRPTVQTQ